MKKRLLAIFCLLAILICGAAIGVTTNAATDNYLVGYAIRDINPWKDPADHSKGLLAIELTGNGNDSERVCTGLMDDNDDGKVGEGDGLFTTATAVTDPYGKTVLYITIDALQGYENITSDVRAKIVTELGQSVISANEIMVSASHSHSAPTMSRSHTDATYYNYIVSQIVDAAKAAYADRAEAVMTKGAIDAKDSTAYLGYNSGAGYDMNSVRHYNVTSKKGAIIAQHVSGSGFGNMTNTMTEYKVTSKKAVHEADNTMYVLKFDFPNAQKEPVVFVNWRAHSTTNSADATMTLVSSDYINSIRANLKKAGYRAAFFQGASGNIIVKDSEYPAKTNWTAECGEKTDANVYGRLLSRVVVDCINRKMSAQLPVGRIQTLQKVYHAEKQQDSPGLLAAAKAFQAETDAKTPYKHTYTDGDVYIINSRFHANQIINRANSTYQSFTNLELNVVLLGDYVAFVTAPGEMSDHYDLAGSSKAEDNDWLELVQEATYGTPFVLNYTNDSKGYFPATLDYTYNTQEYYDITKKGKDGQRFFGAGSYEANTSRLARGAGEELIQQFKQMLSDVKERYYECPACREVVEWKPVTGIGSGALSLDSGHYYLDQDIPMSTSGSNRCSVASGKVLCLDLKGHKMESRGRNFHVNGTLNLFDSVGTAHVTSYSSGSNVGGGVIGVNGTLNIYGGTFQFIRREVSSNETGFGGVLSITGTANMYGGTLIGGELVKTTYYSPTHRANGYGGTVYVNGAFNVYGGRIIAGSAAPGAAGDCVYLTGSCDGITLSGNAVIDEIYIEDDTESDGRLTVDGTFTGKAPVWYKHEINPIVEGFKIGNSKNASFTAENLYCTSHPEYAFTVSGEELVAGSWGEDAVAVIATVNGNTAYTTLVAAINDFREGYIVLLKDTEQTVTVNKDAYLDLNGHSITGKVTISQGKTLYCMDSETDDYTVADGIYGKIADVTGNIAGFPLNTGVRKDSYLMLRENNAYSFHRVNLQMTDMVLRAEEAGVYYKSQFAGDEMVEKNVKQFGVAMSVKGMPTAENVNTDCVLSWFDGFKAGANGDNTSTLLKNVMRLGVTDQMNQERSQLAIYGRAYLKLADDTYFFGESVDRSFRQQIEAADKIWSYLSTAQQKSMIAMYERYADVMESWSIPKLKAAAAA